MDKALFDTLSKITDEEKRLLSSGREIDKGLYTGSRDFIVSNLHLLGDKNVAVRPHTRFAAFPLHGHDYMELLYVYGGEITHNVEGKTVTLREGDLLFLNKFCRHSIALAEETDLGVNVIFSDNFINALCGKLRDGNSMKDFFLDNLSKATAAKYRHFRIKGILPLENLIESLLFSFLSEVKPDDSLLVDTFTLFINYLSFYGDTLLNDSYSPTKADKRKSLITNYIADNYKTASLYGLSKLVGLSPEYLSRFIKAEFGSSFNQMLIDYKMSIAERLILTTDLPISDIILSVGYENKSYFHRRFKALHGTTPYRFRNKKS